MELIDFINYLPLFFWGVWTLVFILGTILAYKSKDYYNFKIFLILSTVYVIIFDIVVLGESGVVYKILEGIWDYLTL